MNDAGKVAFTPKGDYSNEVTYEYLDTVVYNGNAYVALKTTTGNAPTDSDTDENWKLLARGGTSVPVAKEETTGVVKASSDIGVSDDGSMILKTDYTSQENLTELTSGESRTTFFGKIAKAVSTLISHITTSASSSVLGHVKLTDSTAVTDSTGLALPATEKNASIDGTLANQISVLNTNLSGKQSSITGAATTIVSSNLTANRALVSNSSGKVAVSTISSTELGYLGGVTSNIQTQFNGKANSSHTHSIIKYKTTSVTYSVSANSFVALEVTPTAITGYDVVGLIGWNTNIAEVHMQKASLGSNRHIYANLYNNGSAALSKKSLDITCLYVATGYHSWG